MEDLINNVRVLYDTPLTLSEERERAASPPLPSPPPEEQGALNARASPAVYGSSHTVIKTLPASDQPPKLPPRPGGKTLTRRATISSGTPGDSPATQTATGRPSEDGRAMNYINARLPGTASSGNKLKVDTDIKSHSANASATASPVHTRGKSAATSQTASTSEVPFPGSDVGPETSTSLHTPSTTVSITGHSVYHTSRTNSTYANSLLMEPAVLMSQAHESEMSTDGASGMKQISVDGGEIGFKGMDDDEFEVDYPGSPDTSALDFKTAENTPITEAIPLDASTRP
jgi:hypothetical protein